MAATAALQPGLDVWHVWRDQEGVSHQTKKRLDDFRLITFIDGIPSVWQSGSRDDARTIVFLTLMPGQIYDWHENPVPQWIVPIVGRWFVTTMDGMLSRWGLARSPLGLIRTVNGSMVDKVINPALLARNLP